MRIVVYIIFVILIISGFSSWFLINNNLIKLGSEWEDLLIKRFAFNFIWIFAFITSLVLITFFTIEKIKDSQKLSIEEALGLFIIIGSIFCIMQGFFSNKDEINIILFFIMPLVLSFILSGIGIMNIIAKKGFGFLFIIYSLSLLTWFPFATFILELYFE